MEQNNTPKYSKKDKLKIAFKIIAFALIVVFLLIAINDIFNYPNKESNIRRYKTFQSLEKNSLDAVYIGSSTTNHSWVAPQGFRDYGMAVFTYSFGRFHPTMAKFAVEDILKTQDPELFIIDISFYPEDPLLTNKENATARIRRMTDQMTLSKNKIEAILYANKYVKNSEDFELEPSWFLPFIKHHVRWDPLAEDSVPLSKADFENAQDKYMGTFTYQRNSGGIEVQEKPVTTEKSTKVPELSETLLREFLDYAKTLEKEQGKKFLFMRAPCTLDENTMELYNYCFDVIEEYGFDTENFNTDEWYEKIDIDWNTDFYDPIHFNALGAGKFTTVFSKYLDEKYDLPDHRGDKSYKPWTDAMDAYDKFIEKYWSDDRQLPKQNEK